MRQTTVALCLNPGSLPENLPERWLNALPDIGAQVLTDCNRYARDDTGRLIASSRRASDLPNGRLIWRTPYAKRVYYTGTPSHAKNPGASLRWCERAKALHLPAWTRLTAQKLGGE